MDDKDKIILAILSDNSKLSTQAISKKSGLPITTVYHRIKKLEANGIIEKYGIKINYKKIGKLLSAYILAGYNMNKCAADGKSSDKIVSTLKQFPQIGEISFITGSYDIILKVRVKDVDELNNFIINDLRRIPYLTRTQTLVILDEN